MYGRNFRKFNIKYNEYPQKKSQILPPDKQQFTIIVEKHGFEPISAANLVKSYKK